MECIYIGAGLRAKLEAAYRDFRGAVVMVADAAMTVEKITGCQIIEAFNQYEYITERQDIVRTIEERCLTFSPEPIDDVLLNTGITPRRFWPDPVPVFNDELTAINPLYRADNNQERIERLKQLSETQAARKNSILESFYRTGRIDGLYFGRASKSKRNHVKEYIKSLMFKDDVKDLDLIDDCYNLVFEELFKKSPSVICALYDSEDKRGRKGKGAKLLATTLVIIKYKCFAVDPRHGNPRHSLMQNVRFASSLDEANVNIPGLEEQNNTTDSKEFEKYHRATLNRSGTDAINNYLLTLSADQDSDFKQDYGFEIEDIVERLNDEERCLFYSQITDKPRGRRSTEKLAAIELLNKKIKHLREELNQF